MVLPLIIGRDPQEPEAGEVLVEGSLGGRPYRFLLDTGAAISRVASDDYTSGFASVEQSPSNGVFRQSSDDLITAPWLEIGPISRTNITLARAAGGAEEVPNLIGMDVLKDFCLYFDFVNNRLEVDPPDDASVGWTFQKMQLGKRSHPYLDVQYGPSTASAVWDSGAGLTVVDRDFIHRHPAFFREVGQSKGTDSTGVEMTTPLFMMFGTRIGNAAFPPHRVAAVDLSGVNATIDVRIDLILGYSTLRHTDWVLDFPRTRWALRPMPAAE
jgi:hypothetical protein